MREYSDLSGLGQRGLKASRLRAELERRKQEQQETKLESQATPAASPGVEASEQAVGTGPVGAGDFLVGVGDCISSIAAATGYFWETIWNDSANATLKHARRNPNTLLPGDRVTLPKKTRKQGSGQTEMRHRIVRRGEPTWLVLKLLDETGMPRPNLAYSIEIDGTARSGVTDGDGRLREQIPGGAARATLRIDGEEKENYTLKLGHIDPAREVSGIQARLNNLGYGCGHVDGKMGPRTLAALNRFRHDVGLPTSERLDEPTLARLELHHDDMESLPRRGAESPSNTMPVEDWVQPMTTES